MRALLEAVADRIGQLIERRRAEGAVARSEARKSAVLRSALDCIITIDAGNRIVEFNPAAAETFGHRAADAIGRDMPELLIPERFREDHRRGIERHLEHGERGRLLGSLVEVVGMRADGSELPIDGGDAGRAQQGPHFTAFIRDITQRPRQAAEELRASRARIVEAGDAARRRLEREPSRRRPAAAGGPVAGRSGSRWPSSSATPPSRPEPLEAAPRGARRSALAELRELARGIHPAVAH